MCNTILTRRFRMKPTSQAYSELQHAYEHFNKHLFNGKLPPCLITLQRHKNTYGYFSSKRFVNQQGQVTDEISLNPVYFSLCPPEEIFQTLVHEMVHLEQFHFGKAGRGGYHNKEWASMMEKIGLMPSSTGKEGGKKTGDRMADYPIKDGLFLDAYKKLTSKNFKINWVDRFPSRKKIIASIGAGETCIEDWGDLSIHGLIEIKETGEIAVLPVNKSNRTKFTCPKCGDNIWGKSGIKAICAKCKATFFATPKGE